MPLSDGVKFFRMADKGNEEDVSMLNFYPFSLEWRESIKFSNLKRVFFFMKITKYKFLNFHNAEGLFTLFSWK